MMCSECMINQAEYHPLYIENLKFLQDFWTHPFHLEPEQEALVLASLDVYPGVNVAQLVDAHSGLSVDVVWALLTRTVIFTDLSAASLMNWEQVLLYRSEAAVPPVKRRDIPQETPRHGGWPFVRAHMDHTELDIVLVSSVTGKPMAKPWATFFTDAYSRRMLVCYVSYDPPSYRSVMMAFEQGMVLAGPRAHRLIAYSEDFLMLTRPTTRVGTVKIHPSRGITVNGLHYWHDSMRDLHFPHYHFDNQTECAEFVGALRFPSHDKRKTRSPNTEQRWAMEQTTWEVVGGEST